MAKLLIDNGATVDHTCNVSMITNIVIVEWWCMFDLHGFDDYSRIIIWM